MIIHRLGEDVVVDLAPRLLKSEEALVVGLRQNQAKVLQRDQRCAVQRVPRHSILLFNLLLLLGQVLLDGGACVPQRLRGEVGPQRLLRLQELRGLAVSTLPRHLLLLAGDRWQRDTLVLLRTARRRPCGPRLLLQVLGFLQYRVGVVEQGHRQRMAFAQEALGDLIAGAEGDGCLVPLLHALALQAHIVVGDGKDGVNVLRCSWFVHPLVQEVQGRQCMLQSFVVLLQL
mmetsp:Transcript_59853/g.142936  ORF Transcript_59853/g.142936 Transcript_59853/m.142936 type:complete len:230 (-) Transcript_59853:384-1073(-)